MNSVFKKVAAYVLCAAQVFYSGAFAGVGLSNQIGEGEPQHPIRSVTLIKDALRSSYLLSLSTTSDDTLKTLYFVDQDANPLGRLINQDNKSHLIWHKDSLELDISGVGASQESLFVKAEGKLNILNETFSCPTVIEAGSLFSSHDLKAVSALVMIAQKAKFKNITAQSILALHVDDLLNRENNVWHAPQLVLSCGKGKNQGHLYGEEIHLVGAWKNYNLVEASVVRLLGPSYSTKASSVLRASSGLFMKAEDYTECGTVEALFQSLVVGKAYYVRDPEHGRPFPKIQSGYMHLEADELGVSSQAQFHLKKGARFQTKESVNLKGQFFLGEETGVASNFSETVLESLLKRHERWTHPVLEVRNDSQINLTPSFYLNLRDIGDLRLKTKKVIVEGKIEGTDQSSVNISADQSMIYSEYLPPILRVKSKRVSLSKLPSYLERLKVISKKVFIEEGVKSHIHSLEAPRSFLESRIGSELTIDRAQVEEASLLGQFKLTDTFESTGKAYFEDFEGTTVDSTVVSGGDFFSSQVHGSVTAKSDRRVTILESTMDNLKVKAGQDTYMKDVSSKIMDVEGTNILLDGARSAQMNIKGGEVLLVGEIGETNSKTNVTSTGHVASNADFKGDVSLSSQGNTSHTGSFEANSRAHLKGEAVSALGSGTPKSFSAESRYGGGVLREALKETSSLKPAEFSLKTQEELNLSGETHEFPFYKTSLESKHSIKMNKTDLTANQFNVKAPYVGLSKANVKATGLSVEAENLDSEESKIEVSGTYTRGVQQNLKASKEYVTALMNKITVGCAADLSHSTQEATKQVIEVGEELDVSGARLYSHATPGSIMKPQLIVLSGSLKGSASKVTKGDWSYLYEELDRRPELICEGGPSVIVAKNGFWLEAPLMSGDTLTWGSQTGDVKITPLTLTAIRRWADTHKKKNWCGQVSRSESVHTRTTQTLEQPIIGTTGNMVTTAKEGKATLISPQIFVGGDWEIYVKEFGIEAATVLHHYSVQTKQKKAGLTGGTSSQQTLTEDREEVVPPIMTVGGNVYMYCENAHIDSAQVYIEGVLHNHCPNLSFGAETARHHTEEHSKQKSFTGTGKSGSTRDRQEQVPGNVDVGGIRSEDPIRVVGSAANVTNRNPDLAADIQFEAPFTHETFSQYASFDANYLNMGVSAVVGLAATFATGGMGSGITLTLTEAAFACGASMYATSFLASGGDPAQAFKNVLSPEGLRSIGVAMATAGVMHTAGIYAPGKEALFGDRLIYNLQQSGIRAGAQVTVGGRSAEEALKEGLLSAAAHTVGGHFAAEIGNNRTELGAVWHKAAHGLVGAVTGAVLNPDDRARGAMSGAVGAVTAEIIAETFEREKVYDKALTRLEADQEAGQITDRATYERYLKEELKTIDFAAKAGAILVSSLAAQDIGITQDTATTAIENNFFPALMVGGMLLYDAYDIAKVYKTEGMEAARTRALLHAVGWAAGGVAAKGLTKALKAGRPVLAVLLEHFPMMEKVMERVGMAYVAAEQKVFSTTVGGALHKADRALVNAAAGLKEKVMGRMGQAKMSASAAAKSSSARGETLVGEVGKAKPVNAKWATTAAEYMRDMEARAGVKFTELQKTELANAMRTGTFEKLAPMEKQLHSDSFTRSVREKLIGEWEQHTGQAWPKMEVPNPKTGLIELKPVQAHHIIPQQYAGPHTWWNMKPLHPSQHQSGVHGSGAPLNKLTKSKD